MTNQCSGTTAAGAPCKSRVKNGDYCWRHKPRDNESDDDYMSVRDCYGLSDAVIDDYLGDVKNNMGDVSCEIQNDRFTITGKGDIRALKSFFSRLGLSSD